MHENAAASILSTLETPRIRHDFRPDTSYFQTLHTKFGTEFDSLIGLNAMTRPYSEQQRTVAEDYYHRHSPVEVMEVNRTLMNVWLYDQVRGNKTPVELQQAYEAFTAAQQPEGRLMFEEFIELKTITDNAIPPEREELFRAMLIYADLGKSTRMQEYMKNHHGKEYADHDKLLVDILEDEAAIHHCLPSFLDFSPQEQTYMKNCFKSGFHTGQYQQLESLPIHLTGIQSLAPDQRDAILLNGFFDIGGALGDKVQNGTPILNSKTFNVFKKTRDSVHFLPDGMSEESFDPKERAIASYQSLLKARNEEFNLDSSAPMGLALIRFIGMLRVLKPEQTAQMPQIFETHLGHVTQALFVDLLTATGYEDDSLWIEYGPGLARNVMTSMLKAGRSFEEAMSTSMTVFARVANSAKKYINKQPSNDAPATIMAAGITHTAGDALQWQKLLTHTIDITHKHGNEYMTRLTSPVEVQRTADNSIESLDYLKNNEGTTLYIGVGGGSDCEFARFAANELIGDTGAPVVSFPGVRAEDVYHAEHISDTVLLATPDTYFTGTRSFEGLSAKNGPCYIIVDIERGDQTSLNNAHLQIATHFQQQNEQPITRIITVDSGGDIYETPSSEWSRDHASFDAAKQLESALDISNSHTLVFVPGVDAPSNLNMIAQSTQTGVHQLSTATLERFLAICELNGLPSSDAGRYSQMLNLGAIAAKKALSHTNIDGVEPLRLPVRQALAGRPAYGVVTRSMTNVLVTPNNNLHEYHKTRARAVV